jgi:hypothetical protein
MKKWLLALCVVALFGAVRQSPLHAQKPGDKVVVAKAAELKVEDTVVTTANVGDQLTVRMVQDKWLWVENSGGMRGWIDKQYITPAAVTPDPGVGSGGTPGPGDAEDSPFLFAIGVLASQNIYTTYAYIGSVADGYGNDSYSAQQVQTLMREVIGLTSVAIENIDAVAKSNIAEPDKQALQNVTEILELLKQEATSLSSYTKTQSDEDLEAYDTARMTVWPKIKAVLQIE